MLHFPSSSEITIEVNGKPIAAAQSYRCQTTRESRYVEAFGAVEPIGTLGGKVKHALELTRVCALADALHDGIDFHALSGFNVVIAKPDQRIIYSGCEWAAIDENTALGNAAIESVSIVATKRIAL